GGAAGLADPGGGEPGEVHYHAQPGIAPDIPAKRAELFLDLVGPPAPGARLRRGPGLGLGHRTLQDGEPAGGGVPGVAADPGPGPEAPCAPGPVIDLKG